MTRLDAVSQQPLTQHQVVYFTRWLQRITETFSQYLSISEFQIQPVPTLCCWHILIYLLRVVSHKKDGLAPDCTHWPVLKTPSFLKKQLHVCSMFEQVKWVDLAQGSTFCSSSTFFFHFVSQEIFLCCNYTAIFDGNHRKLLMSPLEI